MNIAELIQHAHTANRLQAASHALAACNASLKDEPQVFQFAGANFSGADAFNIKHGLIAALGKITDECEYVLKAGGIEFPDVPKAEGGAI